MDDLDLLVRPADEPGLHAVLARLGYGLVDCLAGGELVGLPDIGYGGRLSRRERWLVLDALRRATVVTCASGPIARQAASVGREMVRVPLGVPMPAAPRPVAQDAGLKRLLFVGSLNRVKDPFTLLDALRGVVAAEPAARLDVVGEDTLAGEVQGRAAPLGLGAHVRFHGFVPAAGLAPLFRSAQLLVVSSRHEAGPVVALEAAAWGVPTVGNHVGHLADAAADWAETVAVGDAVGLADAVMALVRDPARRARMGQAAVAWAHANDADATAARFEVLYRRWVPPRP